MSQVVAKQNRATSGERAKNARSISLPSLRQHYLVAMATKRNKLENKVQIHHRHVKRFHIVKRLRKKRRKVINSQKQSRFFGPPCRIRPTVAKRQRHLLV